MTFYIGCHSTYRNGILEACKNVYDIGGNAVQIFLGDSISSSLKSKIKPSPEELEASRNFIKSHDMKLLIHSVYIINLCAFPASSMRIKYAQDNIIHDLEFCESIGGVGVVVHFGNNKLGVDKREEAFANMASNIAEILRRTATSVKHSKILLETSAGQGEQIGITTAEISQILTNIKQPNRIGICVDTAHIFASGYDIRSDIGWRSYLREFSQLVGLQFIQSFHLNDSASLLGDKKDRHKPITSGHIFGTPNGSTILTNIKEFAISRKIPIILETHGDSNYSAYKAEISTLRHSPISFVAKSKSKSKTLKIPQHSANRKTKGIRQNIAGNIAIADILKQVLLYYRAKRDSIRVAAYQRAIYQIKKWPRPIHSGNNLTNVEGIGKKMISKIDEILNTGTLAILQDPEVVEILAKYRKEPALEELASIYGIGEVMAKRLIKMGIRSVAEIKQAVESGKLVLNEQQQIGLKYADDLRVPVPRAEALKISQELANIIHGDDRFNEIKITLAGSYPSGKPESKDIDIILSTVELTNIGELRKSNILPNIVELLKSRGLITDVFNVGYTKFMGMAISENGRYHRHLDIRLIPEAYFIPAFFYFTSGADFNKLIREKAKRKHLKLSEWGLTDTLTGNELEIRSEADIFRHIGMDFVPMGERR